MKWAFDHVALATRAAQLDSSAADLAGVRASVSSALSRVGRYSAANAALAGVVERAQYRSVDHRRRTGHLDQLAFHRPVPVFAPTTVVGYDDAIAALRHRIEHWSGSDNDPILDQLVAELHRLQSEQLDLWIETASLGDRRTELSELEAIADWVNVSHRIGELRAEIATLEAGKLDLVREGIADQAALDGIPPGFSPALDALRSETAGLVDRLLADLGIDRAAYASAVAAMSEGLGPDEVGLSGVLFPSGYLDAHAVIPPLATAVERAETRLQYLMAVHHGDIADHRITDTWSELIDAAERLDDLQGRLALARAELKMSNLAYLSGGPEILLPAAERASFVGRLLVEALYSNEPLDELGGFLSETDPATAAAFFNTLGPELTGSLPVFIEADWYRNDAESGAARATLVAFSEALGHAQRSGLLTFGGAELVATYRGGIHPARLLEFGSFGDGFLLDAAAATVRQGDDDLWSIGINVADTTFGEWSDPLYWDPREMLLGRVALDPDLSARLVRRLEGDLGALLHPEVPYLNDSGLAAGLVIANTGVVAADDPAAHRLVASLMAEAASDGRLASGVAEGLALMIAPSMEIVVPFHNATGFYERDARFASPLVTSLVDAAGSTSGYDERLAEFLDVLSRSGATPMLLAQYGWFEAGVLTDLFDPYDLSRLAEVADDLGVAKGVFFDTQFDLDLAAARRTDEWNRMLGGTLKGIAGAASIALTGGAGTIATLGLKRWAGQLIAKQATRYGAGELSGSLLPTDNAEGVLAAEIDRDTAESIMYDLIAIELLDSHGALDPPWPHYVDGTAVYHDPIVTQEWFSNVEVLDGGFEIEEVIAVVRSIMVAEHVEIDTGG